MNGINMAFKHVPGSNPYTWAGGATASTGFFGNSSYIIVAIYFGNEVQF